MAKQAGVPVICSMGTGNKLHADSFCIDDISKTSVCPLARVMRRELKKCGIEDVKVLYSKEPAIVPKEQTDIHKVFNTLEKGTLQHKTHPSNMLKTAFANNIILYSTRNRMSFNSRALVQICSRFELMENRALLTATRRPRSLSVNWRSQEAVQLRTEPQARPLLNTWQGWGNPGQQSASLQNIP